MSVRDDFQWNEDATQKRTHTHTQMQEHTHLMTLMLERMTTTVKDDV